MICLVINTRLLLKIVYAHFYIICIYNFEIYSLLFEIYNRYFLFVNYGFVSCFRN